MTIFDYIVIGVLTTSVLLGLCRGIVCELLALSVWIALFFAARAQEAEIITWMPDPTSRNYALALIGGLLVALFILAVVRVLCSLPLRVMGLKVADRFLGGVVGALRGGLIVLTGVLIAGMTALPKQPAWREASFAQFWEMAGKAVVPWLPDDMAERIHYR